MKKREKHMKIIAGNWKMNGTQQNLEQMISDLSNKETENKDIKELCCYVGITLE